MTMTISSFDQVTGNVTMTMDGYESSVYTNTSAKQTFGNFSLAMTSTSGSVATTSVTIGGTFVDNTYSDKTFTTVASSSGMTFNALKIDDTTSASGSSFKINGTYAIKTIPSCFDGTFAITTQNAITTNSNGITTGGKMTVNGVVVVFNSDGTISATDSTGAVLVNNGSYANACSLNL